jgi:hypothetical protein
MAAYKAEEVAEQGGHRWFITGLIFALLLGTLLRLMVAPNKVEMAIRAQIEKSEFRGQIGFRSARVDLADGALPDFALILTDVQWRPMAACDHEIGNPSEAPLRAASLRLPLRWSSLVRADFAIGRIAARNLVVDLDEAKRRCHRSTTAGVSGEAVQPTLRDSAKYLRSSSVADIGNDDTISEIFQKTDLANVRKLLTGVYVDHAEIFFEGRMKSVIVENFRAIVKSDVIEVITSTRIPPATVFGESLPQFRLKGFIRPREILVEAHADLNEGILNASASMVPVMKNSGSRELETYAKLSVKNLPLSMTTPLLVKSKIVPEGFRPRFAWLDCQIEIKGLFSSLVVKHPITLSACEVSGQLGRLRIQNATREPDGRWKPFLVQVDSLDIQQALATFQLVGAPGVFHEYGKLNGRLEMRGPEEYSFEGNSKGTSVRFAGGDGTALQTFGVGKLSLLGSGQKVRLLATDFSADGGEMQFNLQATHDFNVAETKFDFDLMRLKFNSRVEKVLFSGSVADISGQAQGIVFQNGIKSLRAKLGFKGVNGTEFQAPEMRLDVKQAEKASSNQSRSEMRFAPIEIVVKAPLIGMPKSGFLFKILKPAFLGWVGLELQDSQSVILNQAQIKGNLMATGFRWSSAEATAGPGVQLFSEGQVFRDQIVDAKVESKFPVTHRLAWHVGGTWRRPQFMMANDELRRMLRRPDVTFDSDRNGNQVFESAVVPLRYLGLAPQATSD